MNPPNKLNFYTQAREIWSEGAKDGIIENLSIELEIHRKLLNIFQAGQYYYFLFNVKEAEYEYMSKEIQDVLGYDTDITAKFHLSQIHEEDQPYFIRFETMLLQFFSSLPVEKTSRYKTQYDFRMKDIHGNYKRILHQLVVIKHDEQGHFLGSLGIHTDISHIKKEGKPSLSFIGLEGEPSYYNVDVSKELKPSKELLTRREKEVLKHIIEGKTTAEIAQILFLSIFTINNHRKNILQKTRCKNTTSLVVETIKNNWV